MNRLRKQRNRHKVSLIGSSDDPRRVQKWIDTGWLVVGKNEIKPEELSHNQPGKVVAYQEVVQPGKFGRWFKWLN